MSKKILITGANGFIGRNLVNSLVQSDNEIFAFVYPNAKSDFTFPFAKNLHIISCDLNDIFDYENIIPNNISIMYHLAWHGVNPESRNNLDAQIVNIPLSLKCMDFAAKKKTRKVIFPGSTNEYLFYGKPLNKDAVPTPKDAYGSTKVALRYLCEQFAAQHGIEFIYTIIAGIYAADRRDNNVIFYTIDKLLHKEKPSLTKLEQLWDYVYIDDVVEALIVIGEKGKNGSTYAIGHGDNWPLSNYINIIHQKIDPLLPLGIGEVPYKEQRMPCSCIDLTDLTQDTGFMPKVNFDEGISKVIEKIRLEISEVQNG